MTEEQIVATKDRIIEAARTLFAKKGFDGASIRDIAKEANVNVAAVNYHFQGKKNLFHAVIDLFFRETSDAIRTHRQEHTKQKVEDLSIWVFRHFLDNADVLRALFKMLLSEEGWGEEANCGGDEEPFGPPGGKVMAEAIQSEKTKKITDKNMYWAVKMIFSNIVHLSIMYSNHICHMPADKVPYHDQKTLENDIRRLVRVVLNDL